MKTKLHLAITVAPLLALGACSNMGQTRIAVPDVPAAVAVPAGNTPAMVLKGSGLLTYECRAKANAPAAYEWVLAGPDAVLTDSNGAKVGKYYAGPTWEHNDGSKITGKQLAVAPAKEGNIPFQLVQVTPGPGTGTLSSTTYIQRINTQGGVAPTKQPCYEAVVGSKQTVSYSADYVFYRP